MLNLIRFIFVICAFCVAVSKTGFAQDRVVPETEMAVKLSFAPLVKLTAPSVVNIYTTRVVRERTGFSPFFNDPFFEQFFGRSFSGPTRERLTNSLGSGVIVGQDGLVVTNAHVIKQAQEIRVVLRDGQELQAEQVFFDERIDLAILKADTKGKKLPVMAFGDNESLEVGDLVLAIGNPFGVGQTVTSGIVSALARTAVGVTDYSFFIQTDAAINPGNSGGALVSMDGELVGINTAIFSRSGGSLGIGFAIPVNLLKTVLANVENGQDRLVKPWIGASGQAVTSDIAENLGLPNTRGALTTYVHPESPAAKAGLKVGDVILKMNEREVQDPKALKFYLATVGIGKPVTLDIFRKSGRKTLTFNAVLPPEDPPRNESLLEGRHPFSGVTVANINPAVQDEYGIFDEDEGVVVVGVQPNARLGVRTGDVVLSVNQTKIKTVKQLKSALKSGGRTWRMALKRDGRVISTVITR